METTFNLPVKSDFQKGGVFHNLRIDNKKALPVELMKYILPDYVEIIFKQKPAPSKKTMILIKDYCISTKKAALKEERDKKKKLIKDLETKLLEEKVKDYFNNYYKNLYKNCTCVNKK